MEHSNKLLEKYKSVNDKIDTNSEKTKIVRAPYQINMLIESTNELIKRTNDNCEKKNNVLLDDVKKLNDKVNKLKKEVKKV